MIKNISIRGFRGIKSLDIDDFVGINVLIGKNNCGKSSILEALFLAVGISNPVLSRNIHLFRDLIITDNDDFRFMFYKLDFSSKIKISAQLDSFEKRELIIEPELSLPTISQEEIDSKEVSSEATSSVNASSTSTERVEKLVLNATVQNRNKPKKRIQSEISIDGNKYQTKIPKNYKERIQASFINPDNIFQGTNTRIENLLVRKQKNLLMEPLKLIEPRVRDILLGTNGMIYLDLGFDRLIPFNLLGAGFRRIMALLAKILDTKDAILLFDEIENGLHYTSLRVFIEYLFNLAVKRNIQLFVTTHSRETIFYINEIRSKSEVNYSVPKLKIYSIRKKEDDTAMAYSYDTEQIEFAIEQDIEMR